MNGTQSYFGTIVVEPCCNCGIQFGIPTDFRDQRLDDKRSFYCPNGHAQSYIGKTEAQKQRERAERAEALAERRLAGIYAAQDQAQAAERRRAAAKGQLTKVKRRVAAGVCPCCNRTFQDLARHMAGKHPDFAPDPKSTSAPEPTPDAN